MSETPAPETTARACLEAGVDAADPEGAVSDQIGVEGDELRVGDARFDLGRYDRVVVAGGGKAAAAVARGLRTVLGDRLDGGLVVTDGDAEGLERVDPGATDWEGVAVAVGDHPVPGERNAAAAERIVELLEGVDERTLVLAPVTGGGSALLAAPTVPLGEFRDLTAALVESGADIGEINAVRKRLSQVKGGGLAAAAAPATVVALLVSDVVGDDPEIIASGPFAADDTSAAAALAVLERYDIEASETVRSAIREGGPGGDAANVHTHLLVRTRTAIDAAADRAREAGYDPLVLSSRMRGEAREAALAHVAVAEECLAEGDPVNPPAALLSGGEVTVTITGDGSGGPNQELALAAGIELPEGAVLASVDTDGRDGGTDVAGALVDVETVDDPEGARDALADNDSYPYLAERDALLAIESATNVNDLRVVLLD
jgi:hydroxypyruvate reductase